MLPSDFEIKRPIVWLDCETTGVQPKVDRIVEIGIIKVYPDGTENEWATRVHPEMSIPREVVKVHGINDEAVADSPKFRDIASIVQKGLAGSDVGGFNVKFDILFIEQELKRLSLVMPPGIEVIDAFRIFTQREPRDLGAAVRFYLGEKYWETFQHEAHGALADTRAAYDVFKAQLARYPDLPRNVSELFMIYFKKIAEGHVDEDGKLAWRHGHITINFGKWAGTPLRAVDRSYLEWMAKAEFSETVKGVIRNALAGQFPTRD